MNILRFKNRNKVLHNNKYNYKYIDVIIIKIYIFPILYLSTSQRRSKLARESKC